ncbi:hypothetical protein HUU62_17120 [Rhodoferax sp. 4810]|nr:hypothetical protein [Rhodoferax jenense]
MYAETLRSPADIFIITQYAHQLVDRILTQRGVNTSNIEVYSQERDIKPMHVYQLYATALMELYNYELTNQRHPPPLVVVAPINYTPTETYQLAQIVIAALEELYQEEVGPIDITQSPQAAKTPSEVYQSLFVLYVKLTRLNGKQDFTADDVYAQLHRVADDLRNILVTLSQRLPDNKEREKRLLITAAYGINTDGSQLSEPDSNATPTDVLVKALAVRDKLNVWRKKYRLPDIQRPDVSAFKQVGFADVFLQTQIIIAELNIIKMSQKIVSVTNLAQPVTGKTPTDDYQAIKHIDYMLERILSVL